MAGEEEPCNAEADSSFPVDALKRSIQQMSNFALLSRAGLQSCLIKICCQVFFFYSKCLFRENLDIYMQKNSGGKSLLLTFKKRGKSLVYNGPACGQDQRRSWSVRSAKPDFKSSLL